MMQRDLPREENEKRVQEIKRCPRRRKGKESTRRLRDVLEEEKDRRK